MTLSWTLGCSLLAMAAAGSLSVRSLYSATDSSGTPYEEQKFVQDICMQWGAAGYVKYTCNSTTSVSNWYTDAACTTYRDDIPITYDDVGVCADGVKRTCGDGTFFVVAQYSDSACTTKQMDRNMLVECWASGTATTPASQKTSFGDILTHSTYSTSDCTGDAATTTTIGSCGNCTSVPGTGYVMWDCAAGSSLASPMKLHLLTGMIGFVFLVLNF